MPKKEVIKKVKVLSKSKAIKKGTLQRIKLVIDKKDKKQKKHKDKDAPKRPMTAFFCYLKARRDLLKKEKPNLPNTEIVSVSKI